MVPPAAQGERQRRHLWPFRSRQTDGHAESRRLLAMRLCHPEGRDRAREVGGPRSLPRSARRNVAVPVRPGRRIEELGRRQTAQRHRQSAAKMVALGAPVHRRCGARDVAGRRDGHQHGGAGRGRRREPACGPASRRQGDGRGSSGGPAATHPTGALYPMAATYRPAENHQPRFGKSRATEAAVVLEAV